MIANEINTPVAIVEGIISDKPVNKIVSGNEYTWFTLAIHHYTRPGEEARISYLLSEVKDITLMSGIEQGDRLRLNGKLEQYFKGEESKLKLTVLKMEQLPAIIDVLEVDEGQGVLF